MSSRPYARPSVGPNAGRRVMRRRGENSVFIKKETAKTAQNDFPKPKNVNPIINGPAFKPQETDEARAALRTNGPISQLFFLKPLIFLILSASFGIAAILGIKTILTWTLAVIFFVTACTNIIFETISSNKVEKTDIQFICDIIDFFKEVAKNILNLSAATYIIFCLGFLILLIVFLHLFIVNINAMASFTMSCIFFACFLVTLVLTIRSFVKGESVKNQVTGTNSNTQVVNNYYNSRASAAAGFKYHRKFCRKETEKYEANVAKEESSLNNYRPFVISDRASSTINASAFVVSSDTKIEQLASETIRALGIANEYAQYVINFKAFISKTILKKLVRQLSTDSLSIEMMVSLPSYEHYRDYVIQRIKALAESQYLSGHFGDKGDRYKDREWNSEMPSDNQIIMHVLGIWLSYFMGHKKPNERIDNQFKMKYLSQSKEPVLGENTDYLICIEDWSRFYIIARIKNNIERFWAFPGRDSMYSALTLFFYIIKEKASNLLDGADLQDNPICMDRVFQTTRFE